MDIDPEMHMWDCPGTGPGGRGCAVCAGWEGRSFDDIRRELAGTPEAPVRPALPTPSAPELIRTDGSGHADHCEHLVRGVHLHHHGRLRPGTVGHGRPRRRRERSLVIRCAARTRPRKQAARPSRHR
ncbi:hypothetical protein ACFWD7_57745 [Streptomyces mirabilis]|uniref:hypothetical protein n=1 Tax=Streptomyces mirabilis TaxID=68239 RepID=UPI0036B4D707